MRTVIITIGLVATLFPFTSLQAEQIKIGFTGQVDYVGDSYNLLGNSVHQGDAITGFYIYDSATLDSEPSIYDGVYEYKSTPYGILLTIGGLTFQTDLTNVDFVISVENNYYGELHDYYGVTSYNNLQLNNGVSIDRLHWQLDDYPGNALSSDALPTIPPDLSQWQYNDLSISGGMYPFPPSGEKTLFGISGHITSVWPIPEPASLLLFGLGGLLLRKRS